MTLYFLVKFLHVLGATVILGTGTGIAFFMLMAHRSRDAAFIARTAATVVVFGATGALATGSTTTTKRAVWVTFMVQALGCMWITPSLRPKSSGSPRDYRSQLF